MKTIIVITSPVAVLNEIEIIHSLFENGLDVLHLRKPAINKEVLEQFLLQINARWHAQIVMHQHFELVEKYGLKGIHLNEYLRKEDKKKLLAQFATFQISTSVHTFEDLIAESPDFAYVFISKLFDSISKDEEKSIDLEILEATLLNYQIDNTIGLGGINENNIADLQSIPLKGVALLGAIWESSNPIETWQKIKK